jgi:hypothetical protein
LTDVYLFTMDAVAYWKHLGFVRVELSDWREPARKSWQYRFVSTHPRYFNPTGLRGVLHRLRGGRPLRSLWRRVAPD